MNFHDLVKQRYSVRSYKSQPVEKDKLERILNTSCLAPSAANRQALQLIVMETAQHKAALEQIYHKDWFVQAPYVICACGIPTKNWIRRDGKNYNDVDVAILMDHFILAATEEGLGTCWIGSFDPINVKNLLKLPEDVEPIAFTPLGYPNDQPPVKKRKPVTEIVKYI